jgi:enoyl-CoA hydratase/carnithine racemase
MAENHVRYETRGNIGWLVLDRPKRLNAVTPDTIRTVIALLEDLDRKNEIRALGLTGAAPGFCTGADVYEMFGPASEMTVAARSHFLRGVTDLTRAFRRFSKPILAVMGGPVAGGAVGWSLACDLRIASKSCRFVFGAFSQLGINAGGGSAYFIDRAAGLGTTARLLLVGEDLDAERAFRMNLVDWVVEDADLEREAMRILARIAAAPAEAVRQTKRVLNQLIAPTLDAALDLEAVGQMICMGHKDVQTARAAYAEKRPATFEGALEPWLRSGPVPGGH